MYKEIEKKCIDLAKSIIFKVDILPISINRVLEEKGYPVSNDKTTWKYYLNISGKKHFTNNDVEIILLETGEKTLLSKEILELNSYTKSELKKMGSYYKELITKYPNDIDFIKGCIQPIDVAIALEAPEGTILSYIDTSVEDNEINLISSLETYIKKILYRWKIDRYADYENLYVPSLLAIIYVNLPAYILNIRLKNISTPFVHSFFIESFFESNGISKEVMYLNNLSKFWLYRNLEYIKHNIGKDRVLEKVVNKLFTLNDIGIAKLNVTKEITMDENENLVKNVIVTPDAYNSYYDMNDNITVADVLEKQVLTVNKINTLINDTYTDVGYEVESSMGNLKYLREMSEDTKVLYMQLKSSYEFFGSKTESIAYYWAYMLKYNILNVFNDYVEPNTSGTNNSSSLRVGTLKEYSDPVTNNTYRLNSYTAFLVLLKLLLTLDGKQDTKIEKVRFNNIITKDFDVDSLDIFDDGYSRELIREIHSTIPVVPDIISRDIEFEEFMNSFFEFEKSLWLKASNYQNSFVTGNLKLYAKAITLEEDLIISDGTKTIDEILASYDIVYEVNENYDILLSIRTIIENFTTFKDDNNYASEEVENYKSLLNKLTSYSTQTISQSSEDGSIRLYDNEPTLFISKQGLTTILSTDANPLEDVELILDSYMDDFVNIISVDILKSKVNVFAMRDMSGTMAVYTDTTINRNIPINFISIAKTIDYDILDEKWRDIFIKNVKMVANPLEDKTYNLEATKEQDSILSISLSSKLVNVYGMKPITGDYSSYSLFSTYNKPTNFISISDLKDYDILSEDWKFKYITGITLSVEALENNAIEFSTLMETDSLLEISYNRLLSNIYSMENITGSFSDYSPSSLILKPTNFISIIENVNYDILDETWVDRYITNFKLSVDTLENNIVNVGSNPEELLESKITTEESLLAIKENEVVTVGVSTIEDTIIIKPKTMITIED